MQTFFVSLAPALLGGALGALSQVIYILIGVIGFPVFAGGEAGYDYISQHIYDTPGQFITHHKYHQLVRPDH